MIVIFIVIIILIIIFASKFIEHSKIKFSKNFDNYEWMDDVTKMNKTKIDKIYYPKSMDDIIQIIKLAKKNNKKIIASGQKHSMGGQSIVKNGFVIDMKFMNNILKFNKQKKLVTVESGITWSDLIVFLNNLGFSPKTLQSYSSFSVGGSISVNSHGITNDYGLHDSIIAIWILNYNTKLIKCNRIKNHKLFSLIIGGYGLFGIILKVKLKVTKNIFIKFNSNKIKVENFDKIYSKYLNNKLVKIKIARINITNFNQIFLYIFTKKNNNNNKAISNLKEKPGQMSKISRLLYKWILPNKIVQKIRYNLEDIIGKPFDISNDIDSKNQLLYESATTLSKLYNPLINTNQTHILQEFFVPNKNFNEWMKFIKYLFLQKQFEYIILLNITIRYVKKDTISFLKYAKNDMYAFVFYYRLPNTEIADKELMNIHNKLTTKVLKLDGTFYLPYRHHYNHKQLYIAYPEITDFFKLKKIYDPIELFSNLWYEKYKTIY